MAATIVSSAAVARLNATKRTGASVSGRVVARCESLQIRRASLNLVVPFPRSNPRQSRPRLTYLPRLSLSISGE